MRRLCGGKTGVHTENYYIGVVVNTQVDPYFKTHQTHIKWIYITVCKLYLSKVD